MNRTNDETWPKEQRLRKRAEFDRVYSARNSARQGELLVYVVANDLPFNRVGLSVGRRVGPAVRRNAVRRRLREAFRRNKQAFEMGWDIVVVALADTRATPDELVPRLVKLVVRASKKATGDGA
ncbi:MAG: ribonuclease P protein component [Phycisphaerae bacterium]|nr:ribonuclease P protein component [Phycisphaerae bacterium]